MANYVTITSNKKKKTAFWMCVFGGGHFRFALLLCWQAWQRLSNIVYAEFLFPGMGA